MTEPTTAAPELTDNGNSMQDDPFYEVPSDEAMKLAARAADIQWVTMSMILRSGKLEPGFLRTFYALARLIDNQNARPPVETAAGEVTQGEDIDAFEIGYCWANQLQGQTLEDSRAIGRTLGSDLFKPIAAEIAAAEKALGFNPFEDADHGIVQAKRIIRQAFAAYHRRLTQPGVGEGWKAVPAKLSAAMADAFYALADEDTGWPVTAEEAWETLLAAAPAQVGVEELKSLLAWALSYAHSYAVGDEEQAMVDKCAAAIYDNVPAPQQSIWTDDTMEGEG